MKKQLNKKEIIKLIKDEIKDQSSTILKLKYLLKKYNNHNIDFNTKLYKGKTLLHFAAKSNKKGVVKLLCKYGVNPNICDDDFLTPLHYAITQKSYCSVKELIISGADLNCPADLEQTPLHYAVSYNLYDFVKLLVDNGADVHQVDENNLSSLDYARDEENLKIISYLEKGGLKNE